MLALLLQAEICGDKSSLCVYRTNDQFFPMIHEAISSIKLGGANMMITDQDHRVSRQSHNTESSNT